MKADVRKRKGRILTAAVILLFMAGLAVLLYPTISNWLYEKETESLKAEFELRIDEAEKSGSVDYGPLPFEALYQELKRRNEELFSEKQRDLKDPFSYQQPGIDLSEYGLEGNIIGFISIPKMEVELPIFLGANTDNMLKGAVHLTETSYPVGGENSNSVIAAHRGYFKAEMFRHIDKLEVGDDIYIRNFRETLTYRVTETKIISPTDVWELLIQPGHDMVTLITCHPLLSDRQRYVVYCERVLPD